MRCRMVVAHDGQRGRLRMPPIVEAVARVSFAWLRDQYGLRTQRPLRRFVRRTFDFLRLGRRHAVVEAQMGSLRVLVSTADRTIARSVYTSGDWDPLLVGTAFRALDAVGARYRGSTFLEIGANFGVYSLPAVASLGFARAVAYEPDPSAFALLEQNIVRNGLAERVTAHHAALSAEPGELTLSLGGFNAGDNRIVDERRMRQRGRWIRVPARTFDGEVAAGRVRMSDLGLVWLDVQGHELDVLLGARQLLESDVPIVLEFSTAMVRRDVVDGLAALIARHFDILVDLGWCTLTDRLRLQPSESIHRLAGDGVAVETDLLLVHRSAKGR